MANFHVITKENTAKHNPSWPQIAIEYLSLVLQDQEKNVLLNLINYSLKFICMLKIHTKQNVNFLKIHEKEPNENVRKIQNLSLNTGKKLSIFLKILKSKILKINVKYLLYLMI